MRERVVGIRRSWTAPMVVAAGAFSLLTVVTLVVAGGRYGSAAGRPSFDLTSGLLVSTRTGLQVCVEPAPYDTAAAAVARVGAVLVALSREPVFAAGFGASGTRVALRCPTAGSLFKSGQRHVKTGGTFAAGPTTTEPSPFRLFVYVVPALEISRMFGELPYHFASQEVFCERGSCATVTTALYVDQATLLDDRRLLDELRQALGLREPYANGAAPGHPKEIK